SGGDPVSQSSLTRIECAYRLNVSGNENGSRRWMPGTCPARADIIERDAFSSTRRTERTTAIRVLPIDGGEQRAIGSRRRCPCQLLQTAEAQIPNSSEVRRRHARPSNHVSHDRERPIEVLRQGREGE